MANELGGAVNGDFLDKQKGLRISLLDEDDDEEEEQRQQQEVYAVDVEEEEEEEQQQQEEEFVTLGFVEKPQNRWSLLRQLFPSKAGGLPAWLDPVNLPSGKSCVCDICGEPLQFLLQVYAPIEKDYAFHRTLFVFMCSSMNCLLRDQHEQWKRYSEKPSRSVKVFRCQLPRLNPFYLSEPPRYDGTDKPCGTGVLMTNILNAAESSSELHELANFLLFFSFVMLRFVVGVVPGKEINSVAVAGLPVIALRNTSSMNLRVLFLRKDVRIKMGDMSLVQSMVEIIGEVMHWRSGHKTDCPWMSISSQSSDAPNENGTTSANLQKDSVLVGVSTLFSRSFGVEVKDFQVTVNDNGVVKLSEWSWKALSSIFLGRFGAVWMVNMATTKQGDMLPLQSGGGGRRRGVVIVLEGKEGSGWKVLVGVFQEVVSHLGKLSHDRRAFYDAAFCKGVSFVEVVKDPKGECSGGHDLAMGAIGKDGFSDDLLKTRRLPATTHAKLVADAAFSRKIAVNEKSAGSFLGNGMIESLWKREKYEVVGALWNGLLWVNGRHSKGWREESMITVEDKDAWVAERWEKKSAKEIEKSRNNREEEKK
ncbi:Programmed cell death protein 2 [Morella rubra]|uniref:Programmed cell death protein 2 n=1 Tax=Morella rubra TaxID=262757 RepID=A0A6A1WHC5_9ROSI|nr:Programmed cell death protein 2 [Morella rubra]